MSSKKLRTILSQLKRSIEFGNTLFQSRDLLYDPEIQQSEIGIDSDNEEIESDENFDRLKPSQRVVITLEKESCA